jgi:cytochrome b561
MILIPVSGLLMTLYSKFGLKWFGLNVFSGLDNASLRETYMDVHETLGIIMLVIIGIHILGAIKHKLVDKDETMSRMSPMKLFCGCKSKQ